MQLRIFPAFFQHDELSALLLVNNFNPLSQSTTETSQRPQSTAWKDYTHKEHVLLRRGQSSDQMQGMDTDAANS
ncbi:hypothetical protein VDGD_21522 [Verticillium dahliae]|nr:hypothetical protein VDGD_21522 [Verticillium dahliae]